MDANLLNLTISFTIGAISGGLIVHFIHIKIVHQKSLGNKSPNTQGKDNQINIK